MSANLSARGLKASGIILWVLVTFVGAQVAAEFLLLGIASVVPALKNVNEAVLATIAAAVSYTLALLFALGVPYLIKKRSNILQTLGITRSLSWLDMGIGILSVLPYYILSGVLIWIVTQVFTGIDAAQPQSIPFENLVMRYEYIVAFVTLVVLAPIAEELFFRGYFLGKMSQTINAWISVFITALVFGLLHLPGAATTSGVELQWAAAIDTFALGLVLGSLRIITGSIWAGVLLHMVKNAIAFFFLFIYPNFAGTM